MKSEQEIREMLERKKQEGKELASILGKTADTDQIFKIALNIFDALTWIVVLDWVLRGEEPNLTSKTAVEAIIKEELD